MDNERVPNAVAGTRTMGVGGFVFALAARRAAPIAAVHLVIPMVAFKGGDTMGETTDADAEEVAALAPKRAAASSASSFMHV